MLYGRGQHLEDIDGDIIINDYLLLIQNTAYSGTDLILFSKPKFFSLILIA